MNRALSILVGGLGANWAQAAASDGGVALRLRNMGDDGAVDGEVCLSPDHARVLAQGILRICDGLDAEEG